MSRANPLWGAPRIHGELLKLGLDIAQRTVAKYMISRARRPPSQNWKTFLHNHLSSVVSVDFLAVLPLTFQVLYVFIVLSHQRRAEALGLKELKIAPRSPWQSPSVERLIGSLRRECLDPVMVLNPSHLSLPA